jgi:hypothetical protein
VDSEELIAASMGSGFVQGARGCTPKISFAIA